MKIAFVTSTDPLNRHTMSGMNYYTAKALQKYCDEVKFIGPLKHRYEFFGKAFNSGSRVLFNRSYDFFHTILLSKEYSKEICAKINGEVFDYIFAPVACTEIAHLDTKIPIAYMSDATFSAMVDYYPFFSNLYGFSKKQGHILEQMAINRARILIYPTEWAADSAINDYHADPKKIRIVPFGANFDKIPMKEQATRKRRSDQCRLLFCGLDWERKGGQIAYQALLKLLEMGIPAELTVCGCVPPKDISHPCMKVIPFLNKNLDREAEALWLLYDEAHFFVLPTRAECFGNVLAEAAAHGLPSITTDTGGLATVIKNGINGYLLPMEARGDQYAGVVAEVYQDPERYDRLRRTTREEYDRHLNWDKWGKTVAKIIQSQL